MAPWIGGIAINAGTTHSPRKLRGQPILGKDPYGRPPSAPPMRPFRRKSSQFRSTQRFLIALANLFQITRLFRYDSRVSVVVPELVPLVEDQFDVDSGDCENRFLLAALHTPPRVGSARRTAGPSRLSGTAGSSRTDLIPMPPIRMVLSATRASAARRG